MFLTITLIISALIGSASAATNLGELARIAVEGSATESDAAIAQLRNEGQPGLDALMNEYKSEISARVAGSGSAGDFGRIARALDRVARQKDAYSSGLYWYTDLEEAKDRAVKEGKLILSLRLLGDLDEEFSCANSRMFRSILYSDPRISELLRTKYVLHWESVRPAPKVIVDYGDGRKMVSTITGNSIHYVLTKDARIVEALPGLYAPELFQKYLFELSSASRDGFVSLFFLRSFQNQKVRQIATSWESDIKKAGLKQKEVQPDVNSDPNKKPLAIDAAPLAVTKMAIEAPIVSSMLPKFRQMEATTALKDWKTIANLHNDVVLSQQSIEFIRRKSGVESDSALTAMIAKTKELVRIDTIQNEYRFHIQLYSWLGQLSQPNLSDFNNRVYKELFLTPRSDEWLGLYSPDVYTGIPGNGVDGSVN